MAKYIYGNIKESRDKNIEDSIGFFFNTMDAAFVENRWHNLISTNRYKMTNMDEKYAALYSFKDQYLQMLIQEYDSLPD